MHKWQMKSEISKYENLCHWRQKVWRSTTAVWWGAGVDKCNTGQNFPIFVCWMVIFSLKFSLVKFSLDICLTWQTSIELLSNMILCWHFSCHCTFLASLVGRRRFQQPCTPPVSLHNSQHAASTRLSGHEPLTWTVHTLFWIFRYPQYTVHNIYNILLCI